MTVALVGAATATVMLVVIVLMVVVVLTGIGISGADGGFSFDNFGSCC